MPFIHQPDQVVRKASDVSAADWRYQTHGKKYRIFSRVLLRLFLGLTILVQHRRLKEKMFFPLNRGLSEQFHCTSQFL